MGGGKAPAPPDYEEAARQGVYSNLENYPLQYLVNAASQAGGKVTVDGKQYDFTGLGSADVSGQMSDKMAATLLDIQRGLGPQFIQQRIDELKQADPQGYAARQDLFDRIIADSKAHPDRPLADDLQSSIVTQLTNSGHLDARELEQVQQQVRGGQVARGNTLGNAATSQEAGAAVAASDTLKNQQQQQALGFLNSGVTPEDVDYRRLQQSLQNLGAFQSGQTPTAEFRSLSAAGNTAAPFISGGPVGGPGGMMTDPNAGGQGMNFANSLYSGNVNWQQSQVNPWIAGLSTGISGLNAASSLGWSPWGAAPAGGQQPYYQGNGTTAVGTPQQSQQINDLFGP